jgi:hypothetical protein
VITHATQNNDVKVPPEFLPCWPWSQNSCALDALLTCNIALAYRLQTSFFHAARLGKPISRQIGLELADIVGNAKCWSKIPCHLLARLRDNGRNYLLDPRFTYPPVDVNGDSAVDILDGYLIPRELVDWSVVKRSVCDSCGHQETNGTFFKDMRGLWLKIDPETSYAFRSIQNVVDYAVL